MPSGPKEMQLSCREKEMPEHVPAPGCAARSEHRGCMSDLRATMGSGLHTQAAHPAPAASRQDDPSTSQLSAAVMTLFTQSGVCTHIYSRFVQTGAHPRVYSHPSIVGSVFQMHWRGLGLPSNVLGCIGVCHSACPLTTS